MLRNASNTTSAFMILVGSPIEQTVSVGYRYVTAVWCLSLESTRLRLFNLNDRSGEIMGKREDDSGRAFRSYCPIQYTPYRQNLRNMMIIIDNLLIPAERCWWLERKRVFQCRWSTSSLPSRPCLGSILTYLRRPSEGPHPQYWAVWGLLSYNSGEENSYILVNIFLDSFALKKV